MCVICILIVPLSFPFDFSFFLFLFFPTFLLKLVSPYFLKPTVSPHLLRPILFLSSLVIYFLRAPRVITPRRLFEQCVCHNAATPGTFVTLSSPLDLSIKWATVYVSYTIDAPGSGVLQQVTLNSLIALKDSYMWRMQHGVATAYR